MTNIVDKKQILELDSVYKKYGFEVESSAGCRVYKYHFLRYYSVEIYKAENEADVEKVKAEYASLGYATIVKKLTSILKIENALFKDFFRHDLVHKNLSSRYQAFVKAQNDTLPDDVTYEYINSPYHYTKYDSEGVPFSHVKRDGIDESIVSQVEDIMLNHKEASNLVIIEAAAGFGKTATVYELVHHLQRKLKNSLPFVIELSRNREARIFQHILQNEIEQQFENSIKSEHAIDEIKKGRVPLIIDGFDELISRDVSSWSDDDKNQFDSIFNTILGLLEGNACVILTSRKTAIFNNEELFKWISKAQTKFHTYRINIIKPTVSRWLDKEKREFLKQSAVEVENIANPVLLTYLRSIPYGGIRKMIESGESLVEKYFSFLFEREIIRQNLPFNSTEQRQILLSLCEAMVIYDFKTEDKSFIKEIIKDNNFELISSKLQSTSDSIATVDEIVDILSHHALLDRKENGSIGFINEFVLGSLVGQNIINGTHDSQFNAISKDFAVLTLEAYKVQSKVLRHQLADQFEKYKIDYGLLFNLSLNHLLKNQLAGQVRGLEISSMEFVSTDFRKAWMVSLVFNECTFQSCTLPIGQFENVIFTQCSFTGCTWSGVESAGDEPFNQVYLYGCKADNDLILQTQLLQSQEQKGQSLDIEVQILKSFWSVSDDGEQHLKKKFVKLDSLRRQFSSVPPKVFERALSNASNNGDIFINGNLCFLSKAGIKRCLNG